MEINKKELKKTSRRFRQLASNVMNAYYGEQLSNLVEFMNFIDSKPVLLDYIDSLKYDIQDLPKTIDEIRGSYGHRALDLGADGKKRIYLLYSSFKCIIEKEIDPYVFGWFYTSSTKYQDMAKCFGDRLIYPFVTDIEEYVKDISTDMGYDELSNFYININSSGVQVNLANNQSTINATQNNNFSNEDILAVIEELKNIISKNNLDENVSSAIITNIDCIKSEVEAPTKNPNLIKMAFTTIKTLAAGIAGLPDFQEGLIKIGNMLGIL